MACIEIRGREWIGDWIDKKMPAVGGIQKVKVYCCDRLPFEWLPGDRSHYTGITFWNSVYLRNSRCPHNPCDRADVELLLHELVHVEQYRESPVLFVLKYLLNLLLYGYHDNPAEVEARERADNLMVAYSLEDPCKCSDRPSGTEPQVVEMISDKPPANPPHELSHEQTA